MSSAVEDPQSISIENYGHNSRVLYSLKSGLTLLCGSVSGILGLSNFQGFAFYLFCSFFTSSFILLVNCGTKPAKFFKNGAREVLTNGVVDGIGSFVLWWTLFYALVHVYD
ncbi:hypothetical protein BT69DRAFT_1277232 [Atractiella rhizophila]|nr:hypothetical protein BT69DRAFT_1287969 [Atractiella rhizophila]KAH8916193.1 hypothetical protein BT69DRAFT_1287971 [Atractiella rhizophila]KAH8928228.1 hypothetical protein BT69DRAFT_1277232 [Atractiella rhizophila]